ncbi:Inactive tau-tubulin kinase ttbk-6 [Caenorhabditis elegans]|uniref:Inactive tau-tubulin kinase ttbk-6 n=1 Tax=Caenorhabditis elegans TaxID=6239 RepID=TTBK6_CAEEL|nr:Inactive tau-tubulin kinase ttbk-6 [Caenorhabditis elegans]Q09503.2 RecName: Full=Inactive tau-tubulin kinase ttbk-6 [Caenorhabditis elegans]CCD67390.1 Inactive tau-tubulin kinase ttbk-6 [Caenorhabditis elegans]|eukprot:NP_498080.1 Inactive tau-tubulin kinase ttbk-6 [Caenorhabditis elegans]
MEDHVLKKLNANGPAPHIPNLNLYGKKMNFSYMVMTLLGRNLQDLESTNFVVNKGFSRGTWSRVGIQWVYALKYVHYNGFIHRNVNTQNLFLGNEKDSERAKIIHILDFGLGRPFARYHARENKWIVRIARHSAEFRGSFRYASPNVHLRKEQGRVDDVWSLPYVIIELNGGKALPWQTDYRRGRVEQMKLNLTPKDVMSDMPACMDKLMPHLASLNYYQRPDDHMIFKCFWQVMENEKITPSSKFDWENEEPDMSVPPAAWENPDGRYFQSNPLEINGPPTPAEVDFVL